MMRWVVAAVCAAWVALGAGFACAQTDEIQVYTGEIVKPGEFGLTLHNNYIADGRKTADFAGGIVPHHSLNGVPELAYGVTEWLEVGAYLPVYTLSHGKLQTDSAKLRALFVDGEDNFIAGENDMIRNRYRVVRIGTTSAEVEDTTSKSTQTIRIIDRSDP